MVASGRANAILRTYRSADFQRVLNASTLLVDKDVLRVERLLGVSPLYNTLLFGLMESQPLSARIASGKLRKSDASLVAQALAELHAQDGQGLDQDWRRGPTRASWMRQPGTAALLFPNLAERVWAVASLLLERLEAVEANTPVHGNLIPDHVFVGKKTVSFTSFDGAMLAPGRV